MRDFAEKGGVVVARSLMGRPSQRRSAYAELTVGKGRVVVYKDPDPESVARDMKDLLSHDELGVLPFNVPLGVDCMRAPTMEAKCALVQLLNYSNSPAVSDHDSDQRDL